MQNASAEVPRHHNTREHVMMVKQDVSFNGKNRECLLGISANGAEVFALTDMVQLTSQKDYKNLHTVFQKVFQACPALHPEDRLLIDHIQVNSIYY